MEGETENSEKLCILLSVAFLPAGLLRSAQRFMRAQQSQLPASFLIALETYRGNEGRGVSDQPSQPEGPHNTDALSATTVYHIHGDLSTIKNSVQGAVVT